MKKKKKKKEEEKKKIERTLAVCECEMIRNTFWSLSNLLYLRQRPQILNLKLLFL